MCENVSAQNNQYGLAVHHIEARVLWKLSGHYLGPDVAPSLHPGEVALGLLWPLAFLVFLVWGSNILLVSYGKYCASTVSRWVGPLTSLKLEPLRFGATWFKQELLVCHHLPSSCYLTLSWVLEMWELQSKKYGHFYRCWCELRSYFCMYKIVYLKKHGNWLEIFFCYC